MKGTMGWMGSEREDRGKTTKDRLRALPKGAASRAKIKKTLGEYKMGSLHTGSKTGPLVTDRKQAIAIALAQARRAAA